MAFLRYLLVPAVCLFSLQASAPLARAQQAQTKAATDAEAAKVDHLLQGNANADAAKQLVSKALDSASDAVRWRAARAAGRLGLSEPDIIAKLQSAASDKNWIVQLHSVAALAQTGDKSDKTLDVLTKAAVSKNQRVAAAAIAALRKLQFSPEELAGTLNTVLASDNGAVAVYVVEALVHAGPKAVPLLNAALNEPKAAYWACVAIADIGPDAAGTVPALTEFLQTHDKAEAIPQALLAVAAIGPAAKPAQAAVSGVIEKWSDDQSVLLAGLYALGAIDASNVQDTLEMNAKSDDQFVAMVASWALAKTNPGDQQLMETAIKRLVAGLESDNTHMSHAAAHGLAALEIPPGMAAPYLLKAAENPQARANMVSALASLGDKVIPHAVAALGNPDTRELAIDVLGRLGAKSANASEELAATIEEAKPLVRIQINQVLAKIGPTAAVATDELVEELSSEKPHVRQSAMYALREIGPGAAAAKSALLSHLKNSQGDSVESQFERLAAAWTLARLAGDDPKVVAVVLPVIRDGLKNPSEMARLESVTAVGDLGDGGKSLHKVIAEMAESDPCAEVQNAAISVSSNNG